MLKLGLVWPSDRNLRMVSMIRTVARLAAVAAVSVVTLAVAPATAPANTPSASLQFVNKAQLQTDGTVHVTVYYLCGPSSSGSGGGFFVELAQPGTFGFAFEGAYVCFQASVLTSVAAALAHRSACGAPA